MFFGCIHAWGRYFTFNPLAATLLAASAPSLETTCPLPWCSRRRLQPLLAQP